MPELPEVENARALVERNCVLKKIIRVIAEDDDKLFKGFTADELKRAMENRIILKSNRKGKYLWFQLDNEDGTCPVFHFGMTGSFVVQDVVAARYVRLKPDLSGIWPPKFTKLELEFEDGTKLAYADPRRFGKIQLMKDPLQNEPLSKLGFDCYLELPSKQEFAEKIAPYQKGSLKIKALLLDQAFTAGVGNWVADEVLYQARIHPEHPVALLQPEHIDALWESIKSVVEIAVALDADSDQFPKTWLFHYRWTNKKASAIGGKAIEFVTVGSRTSAYVPAVQKLPKGVSLQRNPTKSKKKKEEDSSNDGSEEDGGTDTDAKSKKRAAGKRKAVAAEANSVKRPRTSRGKQTTSSKEEPEEQTEDQEKEKKPAAKKKGSQAAATKPAAKKTKAPKTPQEPTPEPAKSTPAPKASRAVASKSKSKSATKATTDTAASIKKNGATKSVSVSAKNKPTSNGRVPAAEKAGRGPVRRSTRTASKANGEA